MEDSFQKFQNAIFSKIFKFPSMGIADIGLEPHQKIFRCPSQLHWGASNSLILREGETQLLFDLMSALLQVSLGISFQLLQAYASSDFQEMLRLDFFVWSYQELRVFILSIWGALGLKSISSLVFENISTNMVTRGVASFGTLVGAADPLIE